jgi:hypothetical protein
MDAAFAAAATERASLAAPAPTAADAGVNRGERAVEGTGTLAAARHSAAAATAAAMRIVARTIRARQ